MCPLWLDLTKSNSNLGHRDSRLFLNIIAGHPYQAEVLLQNTHHVLPEGMKIYCNWMWVDKKHFIHNLENIWASQRGVWPQRSRGSASTSQTSSKNLETVIFNLYYFKSYLNHLTQAKWPSQAARCKAVLPEKVVILGS